ncbi:MAG: hypothetical protein JW923_06515 [Spirochaetales bacterium]|nr:hypothetical protein [Spirochaetales bacterium]
MKKHLFVVVLLVLAVGFASAQNASSVQSAGYDNYLGYNIVGMLAGALSQPVSLGIEGGFQHSFGLLGLDLGVGYSRFLDYDLSAFTVLAGPVLFFGNEGVKGLWARARGGIISLTENGIGSIYFCADAHLGYNVVIDSMMMPMVLGPFAGIVYAGQARFQWGLNLGWAF